MLMLRGRSRLRNGTIAPLVVVLIAGAVSACGSSTDASSTTSGGGTASAVSIGFVSPVATNPNQQDMIYGMEQAAKSLGWKFSVLDANLSADKQVAHLDT